MMNSGMQELTTHDLETIEGGQISNWAWLLGPIGYGAGWLAHAYIGQATYIYEKYGVDISAVY